MTVIFLMTSNESSRFDYLTWALFSLSLSPPPSPLSLPFPWTEAEAREAARIKELPEWEQFLLKRRPIIALDGYVPNSVVRATIGFVKPKSPEPEWKLKPVGCMESPVLCFIRTWKGRTRLFKLRWFVSARIFLLFNTISSHADS